jgi:Fur family peroxide stress response transcriptional regulator
MANRSVIKILTDNGLKVTPQRIAILEVALSINSHPTADNVIDYIRLSYPHVTIGTVYKSLELFVAKGILNKVKTDTDATRFDSLSARHHHLYSAESDHIEDFEDEKLDELIDNYFRNKKIPDFEIKDIKLQINGKFMEKTKAN